MNKFQALKLYAKACESHKRADWRLACHALAGLAGVEVPAPRVVKPVSLVAFLAKDGLSDDGGEVSARDGDQWHKSAPFRRRLVREEGLTLDEAAERARDAGYFDHFAPATMDGPDNMTTVTGEHLLAAIDRELSGSPVLTSDDRDAAYWASMEPEEMEREYA